MVRVELPAKATLELAKDGDVTRLLAAIGDELLVAGCKTLTKQDPLLMNKFQQALGYADHRELNGNKNEQAELHRVWSNVTDLDDEDTAEFVPPAPAFKVPSRPPSRRAGVNKPRIAERRQLPLPEVDAPTLPNQPDSAESSASEDSAARIVTADAERPAPAPGSPNTVQGTSPTRGSTNRTIFENNDVLKFMVKDHLLKKPTYRVEDCYTPDSRWTQIVTHDYFEKITILLVCLNSLWMMVDTDHNNADVLLEADLVFIIAENCFCLAFTIELVFRFLAFQKKFNALKDPWFVFDLSLVTLMVFETWLLTLVIALSSEGGQSGAGNTAILRLAKMFRLFRMLRITRLMRSMPEFFILIKALSVSSRATVFTLGFLLIVLYVYAIAFTQLLADTDVGAAYFSHTAHAIQSLFLHVTMGDELSELASEIGKVSGFCLFLLYTVILIGAITLMNILIGVLCEAISNVADAERMSMQVQMVRETLRNIVASDGDDDENRLIDKGEFVKILHSRAAVCALEEIGIDVVGLVDAAEAIFEDRGEDPDKHNFNRALSFDDFMEMILQLRGENKAKVKDILDLKWYITKVIRNVDRLKMKTFDMHSRLALVQTDLKQLKER